MNFPAEVRPYLGYAGIGAAYYADHGGAYTPNGYVKRREVVQTQAVTDRPAFALTLVSPAGTCRLDLPASPEEAGLFYALPHEKDVELSAIGHIRIDFGYEGQEFWHTWWPRGPEELNTPEFKEELDKVVNDLRQSVLKSLSSMRRYCRGQESGAITGGTCCWATPAWRPPGSISPPPATSTSGAWTDLVSSPDGNYHKI